jgi:hypothetical protein
VSTLPVACGWGAPTLTGLIWGGAVAQPQASTMQAVNRRRNPALFTV